MTRRFRLLLALTTLLAVGVWSSGLVGAVSASGPPAARPVGRIAVHSAGTGIKFGEPTISGIQGNGFEQGISVDTHGRIYTSVPHGIGTAASFIWRSLDGGKTFKWVPAGSPLRGQPPTCTQGGDTDTATDTHDHLFFIDLSAANFASARSDDHGVTFTPPNCTSVETTPDDRQWLTTDGDPTNGGTLYLAYNVVAGSGPQTCQGVTTAANQLAVARSPAPGAPGSTAGVQFGPSLRVTGPCDGSWATTR